jgi:hypothetical protein
MTRGMLIGSYLVIFPRLSPPKCDLWLFNMIFLVHGQWSRLSVNKQLCGGQVFRVHIIGIMISSPPPVRSSHSGVNKIFSYTPKEVTGGFGLTSNSSATRYESSPFGFSIFFFGSSRAKFIISCSASWRTRKKKRKK